MPRDYATDIQAQAFLDAASIVGAFSDHDPKIVDSLRNKAKELLKWEGALEKEEQVERRQGIAVRILNEAVETRIAAGHSAAVAALTKLVNWVPGFHEDWPLAYGDLYKGKEAKEEREQANNAPICSEAWAYELFGKEDARTFLCLIGGIAEALGVDDSALQDEKKYWGEQYVSKERKEEEERRRKWRQAFNRTGAWWNRLSPKGRRKFALEIFGPTSDPGAGISVPWEQLGGAQGGNSAWRATITKWRASKGK